MGNALDFIVKLVDGITGPANAATASVDKLDSHLKKVSGGGALGQLGGGGQIAGAAEEVNHMTGSVEGLVKAYKDLSPAIGIVVALGAAVASATIGTLVAGSKLAISAATFKEDTLIAFESILGSQSEAADLFDKADKLADKIGDTEENVDARLKKLLVSGFGSDSALKAVQAAADLGAVRGQGAADALTDLFANLEAKGHFDSKAMKALEHVGIQETVVFDALAKKLHKSRTEIEGMMKAGTIDAKDAIDAVSDAVEGRFGGSAAKKANEVPKLFERIKDGFSDMFKGVDMSKLQDALGNVLKALDGPAATRLKDGLVSFFGKLFDTITKPFQGPEGQARFERMLLGMAKMVEQAGTFLDKHGPLIIWFITKISEVMEAPSSKGSGGKFDWFDAILSFLGAFATFDISGMVVNIAKMISYITGIQIDLPELPSIWDMLEKWLTGDSMDLQGETNALGTNMVQGLIDGITGGTAGVVSAMVNAARSAIHAAESVLQINSPSKVFERIGAFTAIGFADGISANGNAGQSAMVDLVKPGAGVAAAAGGAAGAGASGSSGGGAVHQTMHFHGAADPEVVRQASFEGSLEALRLQEAS